MSVSGASSLGRIFSSSSFFYLVIGFGGGGGGVLSGVAVT